MRSSRFTVAAAALATVLATPTFAGSLDADALKYTNRGAYQVSGVFLKWKSNANEIGKGKNELKLKRTHNGVSFSSYGSVLDNGNGINVDLNKLVNNNDIENLPQDGDEIWLVVNIRSGDTSSCRKKNMKIIFRENIDKKYGFQTAGTTLNNNRCKRTGLVNAD